ncbi:MAG: ASCH domain-containing protein [Candidatus Aenigmarchaeota archaeon]|nr:ASCH domain-containing protein [Candidatus Aenigmarchaeota archaeon]
MKCLSLMQPYAELVVTGRKTIENRHWRTTYRGDILVHASQTVDKEACKRLGINETKLVRGAIIGKAAIVDTINYDSIEKFRFLQTKHFAPDSYYKDGKTYGFVMTSPIRLPKPIDIKGRLGIFEVYVTKAGRIESSVKISRKNNGKRGK